MLVENNVYRNVNNPLAPDANGHMRAVGNLFEGTSGNTSDDGGQAFTPPYSYTPDPASSVADAVMAGVGPH